MSDARVPEKVPVFTGLFQIHILWYPLLKVLFHWWLLGHHGRSFRYCVGNIGGTVEDQINGAFDNMEERLAMVGLTLENVVQMDCLFRDVWNIPVMEKVIKERFKGKYPARKSIQTNFAHVGGPDGLQFQADAVAYCG